MSIDRQALVDAEAAVQQAIDAGDWTGAAALEIEFRERLGTVIATLGSGSAQDQLALRATLEAAATRVARLIGEVAHHERRLIRDSMLLSTGRRAAAAYASADGAVE
jgi:hypothetical protein